MKAAQTRVAALSIVIVLFGSMLLRPRIWQVLGVCRLDCNCADPWSLVPASTQGRTRLSDDEVERKWRNYRLRRHTLPACSDVGSG